MDGLSYTVYSIPAIPGQHHIVQYKDLRLQAIRTDPQSFSSTYERERALSYDQWRARLQSRDKITIIAAATFQSSERLSWQHKWVGTVTVLGPNVLREFGFVPPRAMQGGGTYYLFVGVWVHASHRGNGLGKRMIAAGMEWIRREGSGNLGPRGAVLLQVSRQNKAAIGLYSSMGFHLIGAGENEDTKEDNAWMGLSL